MGIAPGIASTLPAHMSDESYIALGLAGVKFGGAVPENPLLINVQLPAGWSTVENELSEYVDSFLLLDDEGRKRARMSYITQSSDPSARLTVLRRFSVQSDDELADKGVVARHILDCGVRIETMQRKFEGAKFGVDYVGQEIIVSDEVTAWFAEHYPNWQNPSAYWD